MTTDCLPIFVFDKDGVLVESEPIKLRLFEQMFAEDHPEALAEIRHFNRQNVGLARRDKLQHILGTILGIQDELEQFLDRSYHFVKNELIQAPPVAGVLSFIRESQHPKFVCFSALHPEVLDQLEALQITGEFAKVFAFPHRKAEVLRELKESHPGQAVVFWGDTLLDYEASREADVHFIGMRKPEGNPFKGLGIHTIPDFQDAEGLHA